MLIEKRNCIRGEITVPGDKSISHRAIVFASLASGTSEIENFLLSDDCISTIDCLRKINVGIEILQNRKVKVIGAGLHGLKQPSTPLNTGRSGTALRLLSGIMVGQPFNSVISRDESAQRKPVSKIVRALKGLGANIYGRDDGNLCPLTIAPSSLKGTTYSLSLNDSQIKTPLLAASLYTDGQVVISESAKSRDHTELMLSYLGADIEVDGNDIICRKVNDLFAQKIFIPGDISLAAFFITAGLIVPNSELVIKDVGINPTRAGILKVYKKMGAKITLSNERLVGSEKIADITVKTSNLKGITIEGDMIPTLMDEIPIIAVAATCAQGTTTIKDCYGFKIKDSGRLSDLVVELAKIGACVKETEDGIIIEGGRPLRGTVIESHNNASLAMSMAIAGLVADGEMMLRKAQILDIVYPDFISVLNSI